MRILDLVPNTQEWREFRQKHIGASDTPAICGVDPNRTSMQIWESKTYGKEAYVTRAMQRGHDLEPFARREFGYNFPAEFFAPVVGQSLETEYMIASFDAYSAKSGMFVEIKCPNLDTYEKCEAGDVPKHYIYQVHHQMYVSGATFGMLAVYFPELPLSVTRIERDECIIQEILERCAEFWDWMMSGVPPKTPIGEIQEQEVVESIEAWKQAKRAFEEAKAYLDICRDSVLYTARDRQLKCQGVTVQKVVKPGAVDYAKVPELKGVNLDAYRKKPTECWVMNWKDPEAQE